MLMLLSIFSLCALSNGHAEGLSNEEQIMEPAYEKIYVSPDRILIYPEGLFYLNVDIHHILEAMPEQDRKALDSFFQLLSRFDCFSYTLFGNKPMSRACYPEITSWDLYYPTKFLILEEGWEVWQSYASRFSNDEFVLKRFKDSDEGLIEIYLINKRHALQAITDNLDTFQLILGSHVNPQQLVQQLCYSQQDIIKILNDHSALIGILFGYGKINSMNFERTTNIIDHLNAKMIPPFSAEDDINSLLPISRTMFDLCRDKSFSSPSKECFPSFQSTSLVEELNDILSHKDFLEIYGSDSLLDKMMPPAFAARKDSQETNELQEDYLATRQKIYQAYMHGSFLEITLNQWMYPQ